jgi:drug/metabolite transporter (DMT)-like permease
MASTDWGWLLLLSLLWGSGTFFNALAGQDIAPMTVALARVLVATIVLWPVWRRVTVPTVTLGEVRSLALMGLFNIAVPFGLIAWGVAHLDSGLAGILLAMTPIFTVVIAHAITDDERITHGKATGIGLGLAGVVVIVCGDTVPTAENGLACLAILGAALSYAVAAVYGRTFRMGSPIHFARGQLAAGAILLAPVTLAVDRPWQGIDWTWSAVLAVVALAVLSTAARSLVYCRLLASAGATSTSLVGFLIPVSSLALGVLLLGERLTAAHVGGLVLIALGMLVVDGKLATLRIVVRHRVGIH